MQSSVLSAPPSGVDAPWSMTQTLQQTRQQRLANLPDATPTDGSLTHGYSSWTSRLWSSEGSEFWQSWDANHKVHRAVHGRISCSSIDSTESNRSTESTSSYEDYNSSDVDDNNNTSSLTVRTERLSLATATTTTTPPGTTSITHEDVNGNPSTGEDSQQVSKSKQSQRTRLVDDEGFIRRAACVCVDPTQSKVLLVSSKKDRAAWLVPGGGVEAGESEDQAALREAWEEAGVQGSLTKYLGLFETQHHSGRKRHRTAVYVVTVDQLADHFPEDHLGRGREWFSVEEALLNLSRHRPLQSSYLQLLLVSRLSLPRPQQEP